MPNVEKNVKTNDGELPLTIAQMKALVGGLPNQLISVGLDLKVVWAHLSDGSVVEGDKNLHCCDVLKLGCDDCVSCCVASSIKKKEIRIGIIAPTEESGNPDTAGKVYEVISSPVIEDGEVSGAMVIINNITEKYRLERHLRQSQKHEAIGTLARGIGHDFNNVLTPIIGYAEIIRMLNRQGGLEDDPYDGYIDEILVAAHRAQNLVEQMLTFARTSESRISLQYAHPIVKEVAKLIRSMLPSTIKINTKIDDSCGRIAVDPVDLHQILMNLCANSGEAMGDEHGEITLSLDQQQDEDGQEWACISIADTGRGISPSHLDRIFDPYFTTKEKEQGTGMGLAVVHGLVYSQGGKIAVESVLGEGSVFKLCFSIKKAVSNITDVVSLGELQRGQGHVLLVDDEDQVANVSSELLKSLGYTVSFFTSSRKALASFLENPQKFDVVMTDLVMPEITGIELCSEIKKVRPNLPVILSTGYSEKVTESVLHQVGIDDYCFKPISLKRLAHVIAAAISKR